MAEPKPTDFFPSSSEGRQREQAFIQKGHEPSRRELDVPGPEQAAAEAQRTLDALTADVESGRIDIKNPELRSALERKITELQGILRDGEPSAGTVPENPLEELIEEGPRLRDEEARERISQYEVLMPELEPMLADIDTRMEAMRTEGIPNGAEYDALRKQLAGAFEPLMQMHQDITAIADGVWEVGDEVRAKAREAKDTLEQTVERIEDIYQRSDKWLVEHKAEVKNFGRRSADYGMYKERLLKPEIYDDQVVNLMDFVQKRIEWATDKLISAKKMEAADATELLGEIDKVHEQLLKLDARTDAPQQSRERKSLIRMMDQLRERLTPYTIPEHELPELQLEEEDPFAFALEVPEPPPPAHIEVKDLGGGQFIAEEKPKPGSLASARAIHRQVRAQYAAVQHRLPEDHRRQAREKLSRLKDMVRKAEHEEWVRLFAPKASEAPLPPSEEAVQAETQRVDIEANVQLAMARATTAAPDISIAVERALKGQRRGFFASLGGAFRLK